MRLVVSLAAATALIVALAGCSSWRPHPLPDPVAERVQAEPAPPAKPVTLDGRYRITLRSGEEVVVEYPTFEPDTLRGIRVDEPRKSFSHSSSRVHRSHYAVAREEVVAIERRSFSLTNTGLLLCGIVVVYSFLVVAAAAF